MSKVTTVRQTLEIYLKTSLGKNKNDAIFALLTPIGGIFTNIGVPFFAGKALADIAAKNGQFDNHIKELLVCAVIGIIFNRLGITRLMRLQANVMSDLNEMVLKKILQRGLRFHINQISGKLVSDALDFVTSYSTLLISVYTSALSLSLILISGVVVVTIQSWKLGAFLFLIVLIILTWAYYDSKTRSKVRSIRLEASKNLSGICQTR